MALLACWLLYRVTSLDYLPAFFLSGTLNLSPYIKCQLRHLLHSDILSWVKRTEDFLHSSLYSLHDMSPSAVQ